MSTHPNNAINRTVRDALYKHPSLSPKSLLYFAEAHFGEVEEVLQLLKHPSAITADILAALVLKNPMASEVLMLIVSHVKLNLVVMDNAVDNNAFSPEITVKMLESQILDRGLLEKITHALFDKCKLSKSKF